MTTLVTALDLPELDPADPSLSGWKWHVEANSLLDSGKWLAKGPLSLVVLDREAGEYFLRSRSAEFPGRLLGQIFGINSGPGTSRSSPTSSTRPARITVGSAAWSTLP